MELDWDEFYRLHRAALAHYATALCRGDADAGADMVQEVFVRALQNAALLAALDPGQRRAWLYTALRRLAADQARRAAVVRRTLPAAEEAGPEPGYAAVETAALLAGLPPQDRALFTLRYFAGCSAAELASQTGLPAGTVRARLLRIRRLLAQHIKED